MTSYIIDKNLQINGDLKVYGSLINIMKEFEYNKYDKKNTKLITELIGDVNIYNDDLIIDNDLICLTYKCELTLNKSILCYDTIILDSVS